MSPHANQLQPEASWVVLWVGIGAVGVGVMLAVGVTLAVGLFTWEMNFAGALRTNELCFPGALPHTLTHSSSSSPLPPPGVSQGG